MAAYTIELTARAREQFQALDPAIRKRVRAALRELADNPAPATVKALSGHDDLLRIRVGDWRIIYRIPANDLRRHEHGGITIAPR